MVTPIPPHAPTFPERPLAIGVIGAGGIARSAHLPAYRDRGVPVVAVASRRVADARALAADFDIAVVHDKAEDLLADPRVEVVDLATGPAGRVELIAAAVAAGKHVLAQKPLISDPADLPRLLDVLAEARARGVRVAVNQNARWAPAWRLATRLIREGRIGRVVGVTHLHDKPLPPLAGTPFDAVPHMLLSDYLVHWVDISRCWLEGGSVIEVAASDHRVPGQPAHARNPWGADLRILTSTGASASIRVVGSANTHAGGCPFWIHGTKGTLRGSILRDSDRLVLDSGGTSTEIPLEGEWFTDGFAGAMGELQFAVVDGRDPENSAEHVLATVQMTFAAVESAERGGAPVHPRDLELTTALSGRSGAE
ncbi:Gfo/Idh/MocA family protein [Microbacterium sp. MYb62]|uniref:Gfo/Idh/MocA family protein n=1 Tax=Microbacterium sp. MYb62 TaxID=1848690 RepID=UPI000CFC7B50|nr:Gfo/Idh/MocA family oxidoreductase [Microbacterium sp. MYb62]PRB18470.1 hypothetical protein CQ042_04065 [Microbacterium sp. MYb62]